MLRPSAPHRIPSPPEGGDSLRRRGTDAATTVGLRLGSAALAPLIKKLFRTEPAGAALVEAPVRLSSLVAFGPEKRDLGRRELEMLVRELVDRAVRAAGPHDTPAPEEHEAVAAALTDTLTALGALDMDDVQAVALGPEGLALAPGKPGGHCRTACTDEPGAPRTCSARHESPRGQCSAGQAGVCVPDRGGGGSVGPRPRPAGSA
ncbi:hypothetical protein ACFV0Z_16835 [Streptomyces xiamenensis]|uniref:NACHT N-terminal Helical domain 1-containing protein n=1 Tax=Streptomyces xiamenensis TaxID=408015 RepID=UPI0036768597